MDVTDLMVDIQANENAKSISRDLQVKADNALKGNHKQRLGLDVNEPVDSNLVLGKPVLDKITGSELKKLYPVKVSEKILDNIADIINGSTEDMDYALAKEFRDNCLSYFDCITSGKRTVPPEDYINAVKFVTFKMAGNTDVRAYALTFPDRIRRMEQEKISNSNLYTYASIYAKGKVVTDIMSKMIIPTHILFQDIFHKAVKVQADLMMDTSISPKVRSDAANSLMTHLKQPEIKQMELKVDTGSSGAIDQLAEALSNLSGKQSSMLAEGKYSLKDIREATIIEVSDDDERS